MKKLVACGRRVKTREVVKVDLEAFGCSLKDAAAKLAKPGRLVAEASCLQPKK